MRGGSSLGQQLLAAEAAGLCLAVDELVADDGVEHAQPLLIKVLQRLQAAARVLAVPRLVDVAEGDGRVADAGDHFVLRLTLRR